VAYVSVKTKSGSWLNVEYDMICVSTCIEPQISVLSKYIYSDRWTDQTCCWLPKRCAATTSLVQAPSNE